MTAPGAPPAPTPGAPAPKFVQELDVLIRARYPLVYLVTSEEQRLDAILEQLAETHGKALLGWSIVAGFKRLGGAKTAAAPEGTKEPLAAIAAIHEISEPALVVLKDFHPYLADPAVVRAVRELSHALKSTYTTVVLLSPTLVIPPEIEKEVSVLDVPLPTYRDLLQLLKEIVGVVRQGNRAKVDLTKDDADQLIKAALGLTLSEAENAFAKAIAAQWGLPLLRLDMGRIFSGLVGSSEENLRRAIQVAESVAPVVLWIDEIEKGLAGVQSSGFSDGGVTARVAGTLLTWLQEKSAPVFVVATANRIEQLPPELLRKGRFDDIFFIDLPSLPERREIFEIHVRRRGRAPGAHDLELLARSATGFSGAEIEQAVVSALYDAFAEGKELAPAHLARAVVEALPLSVTMD